MSCTDFLAAVNATQSRQCERTRSRHPSHGTGASRGPVEDASNSCPRWWVVGVRGELEEWPEAVAWELGHVRRRRECECIQFELCRPGVEGLDNGGQEECRKGCAKGRTR